MNEEIRQEIERMLGQTECPKDFKCTKGGFEQLCRARDFGLDSFLECLQDNPEECKFAFSFGYRTYFCQCPLRIFIWKNLWK